MRILRTEEGTEASRHFGINLVATSTDDAIGEQLLHGWHAGIEMTAASTSPFAIRAHYACNTTEGVGESLVAVGESNTTDWVTAANNVLGLTLHRRTRVAGR